MNIALMAHDNKKELMVQFCTAYAGILSRHTLCATSVTGKMVSEASGLPIHLFMARIHGGAEQIKPPEFAAGSVIQKYAEYSAGSNEK